MSRWLWALLGGVVLVAIAALFWTASNQTNVTRPVSPGPTAVAPAPVRRRRLLLRRLCRNPRPRLRPRPRPRRRPQPRPLPLRPRRPLPLRHPMQDSKPPHRLLPRRPSRRPPAPPVAEAPLPPPAPGREASEVQGVYAPKSLAQLVGAWAYSAEDCERLFQRRGGGWAYRQPVDKFAQAAIVESTKKILLPSATCQIESASEAEGALKVSADCADSISYTSRSVMIALRSPTELMYSASGDPALATTLKKCAP